MTNYKDDNTKRFVKKLHRLGFVQWSAEFNQKMSYYVMPTSLSTEVVRFYLGRSKSFRLQYDPYKNVIRLTDGTELPEGISIESAIVLANE